MFGVKNFKFAICVQLLFLPIVFMVTSIAAEDEIYLKRIITPNYFAAGQYLPEEPNHVIYTNKLVRKTTDNGISLFLDVNSAESEILTNGEMRGFKFLAPPGAKIAAIEFDYYADFDNTNMEVKLDKERCPSCPIIIGHYPWRADQGNHHVRLGVGGSWVAFRWDVTNTLTAQNSMIFKISNVTLELNLNPLQPAYDPTRAGKIRISPRLGGAISYLELKGQNVLNTSDCGKLLGINFWNNTTTHNGEPNNPTIYNTCEYGRENEAILWNPMQSCNSDACGPDFTGLEYLRYGSRDYDEYISAAEVNGVNTNIQTKNMLDWHRDRYMGQKVSRMRSPIPSHHQYYGVRSPYKINQSITEINLPKPGVSNLFQVDYQIEINNDYSYRPSLHVKRPEISLNSEVIAGFKYIESPGGGYTTWTCPTSGSNSTGEVQLKYNKRWVLALKKDDPNHGLVVYFPSDDVTSGSDPERIQIDCNSESGHTLHLSRFGTDPVNGGLTYPNYRIYLGTGKLNYILNNLPNN